MISLHRIKTEWAHNFSIEIESVLGKSGESVTASVSREYVVIADEEVDPDHLAILGCPPISWRPEGESLFEPLQLRENTEYLIDIVVPSSLAEATSAWESGQTWPLSGRLANFYRSDPPKRWQARADGVHVTGRLNFGSFVGIADLAPLGSPSFTIEVACAKIGYFSDFCALLDLVAEEAVGLLFQVDSPTYTKLSFDENSADIDPAVLLFHLRRLMADIRLPLAVETILHSAHNMIEVAEELTPLSRVHAPAPELVNEALPSILFRRGGPLSSLFRGFTPETLPERPKRQTVDTPENRFVKAFLQDLQYRAEALAHRLNEAKKHTSAREVKSWTGTITEWLSHSMWHEVGPMAHFPSNSQVLQKRQGYREILEADMSLQMGLRLPWSRGVEISQGLDGDLRPISELYEYWCFFALRTALRNICGPENKRKESLLRQSHEGLTLHLRKGVDSRVSFVYRRDPLSPMGVSLFYNRTFRRNPEGKNFWEGSYSAAFHPDYSILIEVPLSTGMDVRHWLHFDAKYKLDLRKWRNEVSDTPVEVEAEVEQQLPGTSNQDAEQKDVYKRSDLYKMHTYRDALLGSRGAYILFPGTGDDEEIFIRYPGARYPGSPYHFPSVGAFQLRPDHSATQQSNLQDFLFEVFKQVSCTEAYDEESAFF
jgi:hypothetical protein